MMQSHLWQVLTLSQNNTRPRWAAAWGTSLRSYGLACEQFVLLRPVQRQIEFGQTRRGELDRLPALQNRINELRAQKRDVDKAADITSADPVALRQIPERSGPASSQLIKPRAAARDGFDQRRITFRGLVLLRRPGHHD